MIKAENYNHGSKVLSLIKNDEDEQLAVSRGWEYLYFRDNAVYLMPDNIRLMLSQDAHNSISCFNSLDILELNENGSIFRFYDTSAVDNAFLITGKCNSNCIMCPISDAGRKNGDIFVQEDLIRKIEHIPYPPQYLTITGGEPFLGGKQLFPVLKKLKDLFPDTNYQILTNGRIFANLEYCNLLKENIPLKTLIGIPVHGASAETHDHISQTPGSFRQTFLGIKHLLSLGFIIEIRIVVSRLNIADIDNIAELIIKEFHGVSIVRLMGLEMLGSALANKNDVWIPYKEAFSATKEAARKLIMNGIDVSYYNFPLCAADREFWFMCDRSISGYKVRFPEECDGCMAKDFCGGVFSSSMRFALDDISPVKDLQA